MCATLPHPGRVASFFQRIVVSLVGLIALGGVPRVAFAHQLELIDGNSIMTLDPHSQAGLHRWSVDDIDQVAQHWFWFRSTSTGPEVSLDTLPLIEHGLDGSDRLHLRFSSEAFFGTPSPRPIIDPAKLQVDLVYQIMGGAPGSGDAWLDQLVTIKNIDDESTTLQWFEYSNFDLSGDAPNDAAQYFPDADFFGQADFDPVTFYFHRTYGPDPSHFEIGNEADLFAKLTDGLPTTLLDQTNPDFDPDGLAFAFQYQFFLNPGESVTLVRRMDITDEHTLPGPPIPEPGSLLLMGTGLLAFPFRRRKRLD